MRLRKAKGEKGEVRISHSAYDLHKIHETDWLKLEPEEQKEIVGFLKSELPDEIKEGVKKAWDQYGEDWMHHVFEDKMGPEEYEFYTFHFMQGMGIRNLLRQLIKDEDLPTETWDELYVPALLRASGCLEEESGIMASRIRSFYKVEAFPSGRFVVDFIQHGLVPAEDKSNRVVYATIPATSPSPKPLIDQAEEQARVAVEMDKQRRIEQQRDRSEVREFFIPA